MTPVHSTLFSILCLAACFCRAEDNYSSRVALSAIQLTTTSKSEQVQQLVSTGLQHCLYGYREGALRAFQEVLKEEPGCIMAHIGMLMIQPIGSEAYRYHLQQLNVCMQEAVLNPVEEWYVSTFLQYLNGDYTGTAQAFKERASRYRRDYMAACWDLALNHRTGEQGSTLLPRAQSLINRLPDEPLPLFLLAMLDEQKPTPSPAALEAARRAVQLTAQMPHPSICQLAGHLAFQAGQSQEAHRYFQTALSCCDKNSEVAIASRLYQIAIWTQQSKDKKKRIQALTAARQLAQEAEQAGLSTDAGTLLFWEGKTMLLRLLVLQSTPPGGPAINMASKSCHAPDDSPLRLVQDCLVTAIQTRSLAETGRLSTATELLPKAEQYLARLQREGEQLKRQGGMTRTCYLRAERACAAALFRARLALYKDSADIWKPHLDEVLELPGPRLLPPILPCEGKNQ